MAHQHANDPHTVVDEPVQDRGSLTGFAAVKYGFIFLIVIAVLYFVAAYVIPALSN